jgi:hypothetical protein
LQEKLTIENKWMIAAFVALVINILVLLRQVFSIFQTHDVLQSPMVSPSTANQVILAQAYFLAASTISALAGFVLYRRNKYVFATILIVVVMLAERYLPFL